MWRLGAMWRLPHCRLLPAVLLLLALPGYGYFTPVHSCSRSRSSSSELPQQLPLPTATSSRTAAAALHTCGAFLLSGPEPIVDAGVVAHLDEWLLGNVLRLVEYSVRQPAWRRHLLPLLSDADGAVGAAVGAIARALGEHVLPPGAALAELGCVA
jgi:hypothetical protein